MICLVHGLDHDNLICALLPQPSLTSLLVMVLYFPSSSEIFWKRSLFAGRYLRVYSSTPLVNSCVHR